MAWASHIPGLSTSDEQCEALLDPGGSCSLMVMTSRGDVSWRVESASSPFFLLSMAPGEMSQVSGDGAVIFHKRITELRGLRVSGFKGKRGGQA